MPGPPRAAPPRRAPGKPPPGKPQPGASQPRRTPPAKVTTKKSRIRWAVVAILLGACILLIGVPLVLLVVYGFHRYTARARVAEAVLNVGTMAQAASASYTRAGAFCHSASSPVPADGKAVRGRPYHSTPTDWDIDRSRSAGFFCLGFRITDPQFYQYGYSGTRSTFQATASGDLDGDGVESKFEISGRATAAGGVELGSLSEHDPLE